MVLLIRFFLIALVIFLVIRSFKSLMAGLNEDEPHPGPEKKNEKKAKGVPKEIGEYVDYEEVD
jgi:large-conductance mechanosensitive channel